MRETTVSQLAHTNVEDLLTQLYLTLIENQMQPAAMLHCAQRIASTFAGRVPRHVDRSFGICSGFCFSQLRHQCVQVEVVGIRRLISIKRSQTCRFGVEIELRDVFVQ